MVFAHIADVYLGVRSPLRPDGGAHSSIASWPRWNLCAATLPDAALRFWSLWETYSTVTRSVPTRRVDWEIIVFSRKVALGEAGR